MDFAGFCGTSYRFDNRYSAVERLVNWYCTPNESGEEKKFKIELAPSPSNAAFSTLPVPAPFDQPCRGLLELRGIAYGVNGSVVFSIDAAGSYTNIGTVPDNGLPVSMVANGTGQIFIASSGQGFVIPAGGGAGSLLGTTGGFSGASYATFQDGYSLVIKPNSNVFQISGDDNTPLGDATIWDAANVSVQAGQADRLKAIRSWREYVFIFGDRRSQVYYDIGSGGIGGFPFQSYNSTFIETGLSAVFSLADLQDSLMWIGQDAKGIRAAWRMSSFQPTRVSNYAVEQAWDSYSTISDAVAFPLIWKGHLMYQVTFPTVGKTWVSDATASQALQRAIWHERQFLGPIGETLARPELHHCFCYGKHLVGSAGGDGNPGAVYQYSDSYFYDCAKDNAGAQAPRNIIRDRIAPHLWESNKRVIYNRIGFELMRGVGTDGAGACPDPSLSLCWSNDGGYTWSSWQTIAVGKLGQFNKLVYYNRAGYGRGRVFWLRASDPVYWGITAAMLDLQECAS